MVIAVSIIWAQNKCSSVLFFEKGNTWIYHLLLVVAITAIYRPVCICLFLWICFSKNSFSEEKKNSDNFYPVFSPNDTNGGPLKKKSRAGPASNSSWVRELVPFWNYLKKIQVADVVAKCWIRRISCQNHKHQKIDSKFLSK